jgi:hypothetical protein
MENYYDEVIDNICNNTKKRFQNFSKNINFEFPQEIDMTNLNIVFDLQHNEYFVFQSPHNTYVSCFITTMTIQYLMTNFGRVFCV